jgi:hypothetical protein
MSERPFGQLRGVLLLQIFLATAAAEVVSASPGSSPFAGIGIALGLTALAGLLGRFVPYRSTGVSPVASRSTGVSPVAITGETPVLRKQLAPRFGLPLLVAALFLPFPMEWLRRGVINPRAVEMLLLEALRNVMLVLAALSAWPICLRLAGLTSLFLVLFAAGVADERPALTWLVSGYAGVGTYWLLLLHWRSLSPVWADRDPDATRLPWTALVGIFLLLGAFLAAGAAGPGRAARVLMELMPTSGGTGDYDPAARGGINDGDDETSGENAQSAGFIDTDRFIEDDKPSLYDAVSDEYGEPYRKREWAQAVALDSRKFSRVSHPSENLAARREFPTTRHKHYLGRRPPDRHTQALFFVLGRTPLHLRMAVYDRFDGVTWQDATAMNQAVLLDGAPDGAWMRLAHPGRPKFDAGTESHEFRFAALKSARFPTPPYLSAFRLGKVNQTRFFAWVHPGVLRIRRKSIPTGVSLRTESHALSEEQLAEMSFPTLSRVGNHQSPEVLPSLTRGTGGKPMSLPRLRVRLPRSWTGGESVKWSS